jgi:hypothetical protein
MPYPAAVLRGVRRARSTDLEEVGEHEGSARGVDGGKARGQRETWLHETRSGLRAGKARSRTWSESDSDEAAESSSPVATKIAKTFPARIIDGEAVRVERQLAQGCARGAITSHLRGFALRAQLAALLTPLRKGRRVNIPSFAVEWIAAWNARDLERILSHYASEIEFISPLAARLVPESGGTIRGLEALRSYWSRGIAQSPDLHFELVDALESVSGCTLVYRNHRRQLIAETLFFNDAEKVIRASAAYSTPRPEA